MLSTFLITATFLILPNFAAKGQASKDEPERMPIIAVSGDVEISSIRIVRQKSSEAVKKADLTNMEVDLWLMSKSQGKPFRGLVKLVELAPIEDDTGKLLSTKKRLKEMDFLHQEVSNGVTAMTRGKNGPVIRLILDAPTRQATKIQGIKGKAIVSQSDVARLDFKDLPAISGKPLDHPKLQGFKIEPTIKVKNGDTVLSLRLPVDRARLVFWGLVKDGRVLVSASESEDGKSLEKTYRGDHIKEAFLGLMIAEPTESRTLEFYFKNVELP